jgi:hypothetical protein
VWYSPLCSVKMLEPCWRPSLGTRGLLLATRPTVSPAVATIRSLVCCAPMVEHKCQSPLPHGWGPCCNGPTRPRHPNPLRERAFRHTNRDFSTQTVPPTTDTSPPSWPVSSRLFSCQALPPAAPRARLLSTVSDGGGGSREFPSTAGSPVLCRLIHHF